MSLTKVNYIDNSTVITAKNLNDIQDNIIQNAELIKKAAPRNLLDNSDFTNPVNQRGKTIYTGTTYTVDRWIKNSGLDIEVTDDGILLSNNGGSKNQFYQKIANAEKHLGKTLTFAVGTDKGVFITTATLPAAYPSNWTWYGTKNTDFGSMKLQLSPESDKCFHALIIVDSSVVVYWASLYEGEYTLETLPEYQPKGYAAELAECQRYFRIIKGSTYLTGVRGYNATKEVQVYFGEEMRVKPSVNLANKSNISAVQGSTSSNITSVRNTGNNYFSLLGETDLPERGTVGLYCNDDILLSADL